MTAPSGGLLATSTNTDDEVDAAGGSSEPQIIVDDADESMPSHCGRCLSAACAPGDLTVYTVFALLLISVILPATLN